MIAMNTPFDCLSPRRKVTSHRTWRYGRRIILRRRELLLRIRSRFIARKTMMTAQTRLLLERFVERYQQTTKLMVRLDLKIATCAGTVVKRDVELIPLRTSHFWVESFSVVICLDPFYCSPLLTISVFCTYGNSHTLFRIFTIMIIFNQCVQRRSFLCRTL